jgi:hypothetical protein
MSELNGMTCAELADVAAELALGVLTGRDRAVAIAHLDTCDGCREDVRQLMATGEELRELLPPAEPPAGFETRVLERLGLPAPAEQDGHPPRPAGHLGEPRRQRAGSGTARPGTGQAGAARPGTGQAGAARPGAGQARAGRPGAGQAGAGRPGAGQASAPPARPDGRRQPGRMRRVLAAAAVGLAVIAAGFGGWRIGVGTAPTASSAASPLTSASLVSATEQHVGEVFLYSGTPGWLYMSVDLESGSGTVTCQVMGKDGRLTTIGSFRLTDGYGAWGSPDPGYLGTLAGARVVSANGTVLATGTFSHA